MPYIKNLQPLSRTSIKTQKTPTLLEDRNEDIPNNPKVKPDEKLVINVGGFRHEIMASTVAFGPETRLYWVTQKQCQSTDYDPVTGEYFFDRNPLWFPYILNYYRLGKIHCPPDICSSQFSEELQFWAIDESYIDSCCWDNYRKHKEADLNVQFNTAILDQQNEEIVTNGGDIENQVSFSAASEEVYFHSIYTKEIEKYFRRVKPVLWTLLEEPTSSTLAQIYAFVSMLFIVISVTSFCLETLDYFQDPTTIQNRTLFIIETTCVAWFTCELLLRFFACPRKWHFIKNIMNWIDLCAIVPFFIALGLSMHVKTIIVLRIVRLIRVFRILKLSRHSHGLQILGHTLKSSCRELFLLAFFLLIGVVIFSSLIFYAEKEIEGSKFTSIPSAFWWSVVTMTTIGYGDFVPVTFAGKCVGTLCALCGVLVIALPVPVVVSNFSLYYSHYQSIIRAGGKPKIDQEKIVNIRNLHPWFNPGFTTRSSLVSATSRNSFCISPLPGSPNQLSPSYSLYHTQSNLLTLRQYSIPNTPLQSPKIIDKETNLTPRSPKHFFKSLPVFNMKEEATKTSANKTSIQQFFVKECGTPQSTQSSPPKAENLTINVYPPSHSCSEAESNNSGSNPRSASDRIFTFQPLENNNNERVEPNKNTFDMAGEAEASPATSNVFLSPQPYHSNLTTSSNSPASIISTSDYSSQPLSTCDSTTSLTASPTTRMGRRNAVIMVGVFGTRWRRKCTDAKGKKGTKEDENEHAHNIIRKDTPETKTLEEVSRRLENYKNKMESTIPFHLSPLSGSKIHARRKAKRDRSLSGSSQDSFNENSSECDEQEIERMDRKKKLVKRISLSQHDDRLKEYQFSSSPSTLKPHLRYSPSSLSPAMFSPCSSAGSPYPSSASGLSPYSCSSRVSPRTPGYFELPRTPSSLTDVLISPRTPESLIGLQLPILDTQTPIPLSPKYKAKELPSVFEFLPDKEEEV